MKIAESRR